MNDNEAFELKAKAFAQMTGELAPGKDVAPAADSESRQTIRKAAWKVWNEQYGPVIDRVLQLVSEKERAEMREADRLREAVSGDLFEDECDQEELDRTPRCVCGRPLIWEGDDWDGICVCGVIL